MPFNPSQPRIPAGQGGGGRWGGGASGSKANAPRNAAAAKIQANPAARTLFDKAIGLSPKDRAKFMHELPDADLKLLTQALYSARTSDHTIVQARFAVAHEMGKRGIDIKKFGALGGGLGARGHAEAKRRFPAKKASPK